MERYLSSFVKKDLEKKMVFITGPRQVGKTFFSKQIGREYKRTVYLNQDDLSDSAIIRQRSWPLNTELIILDEIHKMKNWKTFLKGTFDTHCEFQSFLVTGSARLDTFRQSGESLAGRYYHYRLHPFSVKELSNTLPAYEALSSLIRFGGFPEPFLSASEDEGNRWRKQYYNDLIREDILDFSRIGEIRALKLLLEMLRKRVGSPLSYSSLAQDLQIAPNTVKKYLDILESLYIIFTIRPFHKNIARSLLKEPKIYFYDSGYVDGDDGIKLENTVATCLMKHVHFLQDSKGKEIALHYIRTKDGKEIDFALSKNDILTHFLEVKLSDTQLSRTLKYFRDLYPAVKPFQLVHNIRNPIEIDNISIVSAGNWLSELLA
ncbi:MAG: ATP-binding protein [Candidatus Riflebacteria bacterium]|nr:ATP-binding protein [Candidatus Riflebacteria bacterium]